MNAAVVLTLIFAAIMVGLLVYVWWANRKDAWQRGERRNKAIGSSKKRARGWPP